MLYISGRFRLSNDNSNLSWVFSVAAATMLAETNLLGKYAKEKSKEEDDPKWKSCYKG